MLKFTIPSIPDFDAEIAKMYASSPIKLSEDFEYKLEFILFKPVQIKSLIGKICSIAINSKTGNYSIKGLITQAKINNNRNVLGINQSLCLTINSVLYKLKLQEKFKIYIDKTPKEIISEILTAAELAEGDSFSFDLQNQYPSLDCWCQYNESDYANLIRLLAYYGIYFYFDKNHSYKITFIDCQEQLPRLQKPEIKYHDGISAEAITNIKEINKLLTDQIVAINYDNANPGFALRNFGTNTTNIIGRGISSDYGVEYSPTAKQISIDCAREQYTATTTNKYLNCGDNFYLTDHPNPDYNRWYKIVSITPTAVNNARKYSAVLTLIRTDLEFSLCVDETKQVPGILLAKSQDYSDSAYKFSYFYDPEQIHVTAIQAQPLVGGGRHSGFNFPIRPGAMLVIGFKNQSINQPVILGGLHHKSQASPVVSNNAAQHILSTQAQNRLKFDDKAEDSNLEISTKNSDNNLLLTTKDASNKISIESQQGDINITSKKDVLSVSNKDYVARIKGNIEFKVKNNVKINSNSKFYLTSGNCLAKTVTQSLNINTLNSDITFKAAGDIVAEAKSQSIVNSSGRVNLQASVKDVKLEATNNIQLTAEDKISIMQSDACIEVADGKIQISTASDINIMTKNALEILGKHDRGGSGSNSVDMPEHGIEKIELTDIKI